MVDNSIVKLKLLITLINKYENSLLSKQGTKINKEIKIYGSNSIFKKSYSSNSYKYRPQIEHEIDELVNLGFIYIKKDHNNDLKEVIMNLEKVNEIYVYLKRDNPQILRNDLLEAVKKYISFEGMVGSLARYLRNRLDKYESVKSFCSNVEEYLYINKIITNMETQEEDITIRQFSVKYLGNSKAFEKIEGKICKIINLFTNEELFDNTELLERFNIYKNPTYIYIKGNIVISINDQIIDLEKLGCEISLTSKAIKNLKIVEIKTNNIITIENLTSFVVFDNPKYVSIYLAGFHNDIKTEFFKKIYQSNKDLNFYHFGDIDAGGFYILDNLINKTNINFVPLYMDVSTLKKYKDNWISLTSNDKIRLERILDSKYFETIDYMLKNNCKLEQENII